MTRPLVLVTTASELIMRARHSLNEPEQATINTPPVTGSNMVRLRLVGVAKGLRWHSREVAALLGGELEELPTALTLTGRHSRVLQYNLSSGFMRSTQLKFCLSNRSPGEGFRGALLIPGSWRLLDWVDVTELNKPVSVRALAEDDLAWCGWAGSSTHLGYVRRALVRAGLGEVAYLAVCPPSNRPVAIGGVDFAATPGVGTLWQLVVHPALRSCGHGTILVQACEAAVVQRSLRQVELSVERDNPRAYRLYRRLGYVDAGHKTEQWESEAPHGTIVRQRTVGTVMRKDV